jgi:hypothetical protein
MFAMSDAKYHTIDQCPDPFRCWKNHMGPEAQESMGRAMAELGRRIGEERERAVLDAFIKPPKKNRRR